MFSKISSWNGCRKSGSVRIENHSNEERRSFKNALQVTLMEFFEKYQAHILYFFGVIAAVIILRSLTVFFHKRLVVKSKKRFPTESTSSLDWIRRILNVLWIVLGVVALTFLFASKEEYNGLTKDFKLIAYLGFVAVATVVAASSVNMWFQYLIRRKQEQNSDPTNLKFLRYAAIASVYFIGVLLAILAFPALRGIAQTALGGAGILAVVAGIASQEALANVVSGIFIISFKPFKVGDIIELAGTMEGTVVDITLRHTLIRNFSNNMIVIPNAIINKERLINMNTGATRCCERLEIGISYDSNVELAKKIMQEECEKHPLIVDNRNAQEREAEMPIVKTALTRLGESSVTVRAWAWVSNYSDMYELRWDVYESAKKRFEAEGIEIPYPYRTVIVRQEKDFKIGTAGSQKIEKPEQN